MGAFSTLAGAGTRPDIAYEIHGDPAAPAVFLAHGGGQTRHSWRGLIRRLTGAGFRTVTYDLRGHGDSAWASDGQYGPDRMGQDLRDLIAHVGGGRPRAVVGASAGGLGAYHALATAGRPIADCLILLDIVIRPNDLETDRIKQFMLECAAGFASLEAAAAAVQAYEPGRGRAPAPASLARNMRQSADGRWYWHWDPRLLDAPLGNRRASLLAAVGGGLNVPLLLIRGEFSDMVDDAGVAEMRHLHPAITVTIARGAGHMIASDGNDEFADAILAQLKTLPP